MQYDNLINLMKSKKLVDKLNENDIINLFNRGCEKGDKSLIEWLHNNFSSEIEKNINDVFFFQIACKNGHKEIAEWLLNKFPSIDIHACEEYAFNFSCINGHKEIAEWLYNLSETKNHRIDIHAEDEFIFQLSCSNGHREVAEWLYNLSIKNNNKINIHLFDNYVFRFSCLNGHREVAEWLCTLDSRYIIKYENNELKPHIKRIKEIIEENEIEKFIDTSIKDKKLDDCIICLDNISKYWIKLDCNHEICFDCFTKIERCPYRCNEYINEDEIKIYKSINFEKNSK